MVSLAYFKCCEVLKYFITKLMVHQTAWWLRMKYLKRCGRKQQGLL